MSLVAGQRLGAYEILSPLGAGGMGEVYRARDLRLGRDVAIKVLPHGRAADETRKRRFLREARAVAALDHPSIVAIHEIESADGIDFIVMENVRGQTLDLLIGKGLRLDEVLQIAIPIADALARAHAAGIVHRDLKPANVMVTPEGSVKVLDFGLAKLVGEDSSPGEETLSDETGGPLSQPGAISGTPGYMSPEQATGKRLDARSDIFSFGSVLYEMVTGRRAFAGASRQETLAAVVSAEPRPPSEVAPDVPAELQKLIQRCLRKDPDRRVQAMADVRVALQDARDEVASGRAGSVAVSRRSHPWRSRFLTLGSLLLVAVGALVAWRLRSTATPVRSRSITRVTWDSGLATDPAPSPAGNLLAYASDRGGRGNLDIWLQPLPRGEPIRLTDDPADDYEPSFSPDGSRIAFRSDRDGGAVYVVSALGGPATRIAEKGRRPRFSPDGQWIAYYVGDTVLSGGTVHVVAAGGGSARQIGSSVLKARRPIWSPDGTHLLCVAFPNDDTQLFEWIALPLDGGAPRETGFREALRGTSLVVSGEEGWSPASMPDAEHALFSARSGDSTNIWRLTFSPKTWRISGAPEQVTFGTGIEEKAAVVGNRMFFVSATGNVDLWSLPLDPRSGRVAGALERLTNEPGRDDWPSVSADGKRLAFLSERAGAPAVRLQDAETRRELPVTLAPTQVGYPRISADGTKVVYLVPVAQRADVAATPLPGPPSNPLLPLPISQRGALFVASVGASGDVGVPHQVCEGCARAWDWSRDGRYVAYRGLDGIQLLDVESGSRVRLAAHASANAFDVRFSPDDAWITFTLNFGSLRRRIVVAPFRGPIPIPESEWVTVIDGETLDRQAAWAADANALYFHSQRDGFRCLWMQRLDPLTKRPLGSPLPIEHFHGVQHSMTTAIPDPGAISISVARNRIVFSLGEMAGNIWMTSY